MALLMYATVQGDREQWFWGLLWAQKVEQLNAAFCLSCCSIYSKWPTFFSPISTASHQPVFSGGGCGISRWGEGNNHSFPTADWFIEKIPIGKQLEGLGKRDQTSPTKKKKAIAAVQQGYLWSCPSESFMSTHTCTRAHTHAQPRLNKHFKLAGQDHRLFSIWIAGEGRKIVQHSLFGLLVLLRLIQVKEESGTWDTNKTSSYQTNTHAQMLKVSPPLRHLTMTSTQKLLQLERVLRLLSSLTFQHNINTKTHP